MYISRCVYVRHPFRGRSKEQLAGKHQIPILWVAALYKMIFVPVCGV